MVLCFDDENGEQPHYLLDFVARVLVECPKCQVCAVVECADGRHGTPVLTCPACAFSRRGWPPPTEAEMMSCTQKRCRTCNDWLGEAPVQFRSRKRVVEVKCKCGEVSVTKWSRASMVLGDAFDPYFRLPLWLRADVHGHTFWAYNRDHLSFLEAFIRADARSRAPNHNTSLVSRLPRWMKLSTARQPLLRAIAKIARR